MSDIFLNNWDLCYVDNSNKQKILLKLDNYTYNKSKIPFHLFDENGQVMLVHEKTLLGKCVNINGNTAKLYGNNGEMQLAKMLCTYLTAKFCTHITRPANVALIGCEEAVLYSSMSIIGMYNKASQVTLIQEEIQNNGENYFLSVLLNIENPPEVSLNVSDYRNTKLQGDSFDHIVVNGKILGENSELKLKEINRLYNANGSVIFILDDQPELLKQIKNICGEYECYSVSKKIKVVTVSDKIHSDDRIIISEKYEYLKRIDESDFSDDKIREISKELKNDIDILSKLSDVKQKIQAIELREYLISYMLFDEYKSHYLKEIRNIL